MQKENMNHQLCFFKDLLFSRENIIEKLSERSSTPLADRPDMVFKDNKSLNTNYENFLKLLTMPPTYVEILGATGCIPGILNGHFCKYKPKEELVDEKEITDKDVKAAVDEAVEQVIELGDWVFLEEEGTEPNVELNEELLIVEEDKEPEDWLFVVKKKKDKHVKGSEQSIDSETKYLLNANIVDSNIDLSITVESLGVIDSLPESFSSEIESYGCLLSLSSELGVDSDLKSDNDNK